MYRLGYGQTNPLHWAYWQYTGRQANAGYRKINV
jgi:hypothetical protein